MNDLTKTFLTILAMVAVICCTIFNFISGKIDTMYFVVLMAILCIPLVNMVNILIRDWKNK